MKCRLTVFLVAIFGVLPLSAQVDNRPQPTGVAKVKYEADVTNGTQMFSVRNSRLGIKGNIGENVRYSVLAEVSTQGTIGLLDSYVGYRIGKFEIVAGQQPYYTSTEVTRGATGNYFANRSFIGKFLTRYYDNDPENLNVRDLTARDLGVMLHYSFGKSVPFKAMLGLFNGSGMNNPQWKTGVNFAARLDVGGDQGFSGGVGGYAGKTTLDQMIIMASLGGRYRNGRLHVEMEGGLRHLDARGIDDMSVVAVAFGLYRFPIQNKYVKSVAPLLRYDIGDNVKYLSAQKNLEAVSPQRITGGITVGFAEKELKAEIRLNYEHYIMNRKPQDFSNNPLFHNKIVLEFLAAF